MAPDPESEEVPTFTILTAEPSELMAPIHNRMPVILQPDYEREWLSGVTDEVGLSEMLGPYPAHEMRAHPVSSRVGSPKHDDAELIASEQDPMLRTR